MPGTIDDLRAVGRPPGAAIVTRRRRELSQIAAIDIHRVDVEVPVLQRGEDELLPIRRDDAFRGVDAVAREPVQLTAVGASSVDVVRIETPHVPLRRIGLRGTVALLGVRRSEENALIVRVEEAAGGLARPGRHAMYAGAVDVHDELLIAGASIASALEDQATAIGAEIRFGVLAAIGELPEVSQMSLACFGSHHRQARPWVRAGDGAGGSGAAGQYEKE